MSITAKSNLAQLARALSRAAPAVAARVTSQPSSLNESAATIATSASSSTSSTLNLGTAFSLGNDISDPFLLSALQGFGPLRLWAQGRSRSRDISLRVQG